ncbi:hypothetical protein EYV94_27425 [Puteibacter caeruleilacunae]|nr:hypothetical protein EYV94_27425 [Puteibacter caeruleilacunae]
MRDDKNIQNNNPFEMPGKENPFSTPEGYFESFNDRLQGKIEEQENPQKGKVLHMLRPALGLVASFLVVFLLLYVPLKIYMPKIAEQYYSKEQVVDTTEGMEAILAEIEDQFFLFESTVTNETEELEPDQIMDCIAMEIKDYDLIFAESLNN